VVRYLGKEFLQRTDMSCIPSIESIFLQVHQSFELAPYSSKQKAAFANLKRPIKTHHEQFIEIIDSIFRVLEIHNDPQACVDLTYNIENFADFQKALELNTWTFSADSKQVIWQLISHSYIPGIARFMANWNLDDINDKGMPGGHFWYLPTETEDGEKVTMPVTQVCNWLLDLLGIPLDQVRNLSLENTNTETLIRNIYNWKNGKVPRFETIKKSFPDNADIEFKGCLKISKSLSEQEQLQEIISFAKEKGLTSELLTHEIPIRDVSILKQIIDGKGEEEHNQKFVRLMSIRYTQPTFKTIRQRLHVAKAMQDGYKRLLKFLCGDDVLPTCSNLNENKVLQLCHIYKFIYNLTIEAYRVNSNQAEEDKWFDSKLSEIDKNGLFLSVAPSRFSCSYSLLGELLTKRFQRTFSGEVLPNLFDPNPESKLDVFKQKLDEQTNWAEETIAQIELEKLVRKGSPWRALQKEDMYWVVTQVAQNNSFSFRIKEAAIKRLHEISKSPFEKAGVVLLETSFLLDLPKNKRPSDTQDKITSLLIDIEQHPGFEIWKAPLLCAKAKHYVAINDFKSAVQYFKKGLAACDENSYGPLRGFIAKDAFSTILQIEKRNSNNHEKYMREMLANGVFEYVDPRKPVELESLAKDLNCYFWDELYKPYLGIKKLESSTETL
jgi:hypothetical protein